ncbi:MAG: S49 family peptidase, partial [Candidatus Cloacimonetes bacterium]|nr:S49 family peptidase [Candidatus Cloacimonadota bacterium]
TITGSIGVIQLLPDATELGKKIGINNQTIAYGKFADAYNFLTPPSSELLVSLQRSSDNVYNEFKQRVVKYRKIDYDELENLAGGRIWSAEDAMQNHLIDQVGSLNDAIMKAAELAKIKTYQTTVLPQKKQYWEYLFEQINQWQVVHKPISIKDLSDIVINQMRDIFKPYSVLCIMPFELE